MENVQSENNIEEKQAALNMDHKCTVCHKSYCEPKLLPCGHLMCRKCLLSWLKQTRRATCPYCRYSILKDDEYRHATPSASQSKDDTHTEGDQGCTDVDDEQLQVLVDGFPTELWTAALVKAEKLLREKQKCQVCEEQATSICLQCGDTLCGSCKQLHSKFTMSSHHTVEDLSSLTAERLVDFQPPTSCPQHPNQPCQMFCTQHTTSLCMMCAFSLHRQCPQITEIEQMEQARAKLVKLIKVMTDSSAEIEGAVLELEQHLADIEQRTETTLADIQTLKERLTKAVDDCCQRLEQQICAALEDIRQVTKEAKGVLLGRQSRLGSHTALARRVHDCTARDVVCGMTSVVESRLNDLDRRLDMPYGSKIITTATLTVDDDVVQSVEKELAELGSINVQFTAIAANVYEVFHHNHVKEITLSNDDRKATYTKGSGCKAVVVRKPVTVGDLVEVKIDVWTGLDSGDIYLGMTRKAPDVINMHAYIKSIPCSWIISSLGVFINNSYQKCANKQEEYLKPVKQGSRVGLLLDHNLDLHLYIDGRDCGVFVNKVAPPCYAVFNFYSYNQPVQITLLPRRKIEM